MDGTGSLGDERGILFPARLPQFDRHAAPASLTGLVRWFWVPRWQLPPGTRSRQVLLPHPATNLVVGPQGVTVAGPTSRVAHRDLEGTGWAVGALLRPAAVLGLGLDPGALRDREDPWDAPGLHRSVAAAMAADDPHAGAEAAVAATAHWLADRLPAPTDEGLLANAFEELALDRTVVRVEQAADRLGTTVRALQRLCRRSIGVPPLAVIRRHRLQEAADRLRSEPSTSVADVAAELGYADQSHLAADFRTVLGLAAGSYRRDPASAPRRTGPPLTS